MPSYPDVVGLHPDQGMTATDIDATLRVAKRRDEIIMFRDTGAWSRPYIAAGHPTKPFHVKGKSSDWGPHAGLVPYNSEYSKAFDAKAIAKGQALNKEAVNHNYAMPVPLFVAPGFIDEHLLVPKGARGNRPIDRVTHPRDGIAYYFCTKPNDDAGRPGKPYVLIGKKQVDGRYQIFTIAGDGAGVSERQLFLKEAEAQPLLVMSVPGANGKPITGDYDLFAVCPSHGQFGRQNIVPGKGTAPPRFEQYDSKMDPTLDHRAQNASFARTASKAYTPMPNPQFDPRGAALIERAQKSMAKIEAARTPEDEHRGNLTPRIRDAITALVAEMGGAFPRVHHNAESGRPFAPGAEDGMPLTVFHPRAGIGGYRFRSAIISDRIDLQNYFTAIYQGGYYPPRNAAWNMAWVRKKDAAEAAFRSMARR